MGGAGRGAGAPACSPPAASLVVKLPRAGLGPRVILYVCVTSSWPPQRLAGLVSPCGLFQDALAVKHAWGAGPLPAARDRRPPPLHHLRAGRRRRYTCTLARQFAKNWTIPSYCASLCRDNASCAYPQALRDTNVPTFSLPKLSPGAGKRVSATRVVTYVGDGAATFTPAFEAPAGFAFTVTVLNATQAGARSLAFARANQTRAYTLEITLPAQRPAGGLQIRGQPGLWYFGALTWRDTLNRFSARSAAPSPSSCADARVAQTKGGQGGRPLGVRAPFVRRTLADPAGSARHSALARGMDGAGTRSRWWPHRMRVRMADDVVG